MEMQQRFQAGNKHLEHTTISLIHLKLVTCHQVTSPNVPSLNLTVVYPVISSYRAGWRETVPSDISCLSFHQKGGLRLVRPRELARGDE